MENPDSKDANITFSCLESIVKDEVSYENPKNCGAVLGL